MENASIINLFRMLFISVGIHFTPNPLMVETREDYFTVCFEAIEKIIKDVIEQLMVMWGFGLSDRQIEAILAVYETHYDYALMLGNFIYIQRRHPHKPQVKSTCRSKNPRTLEKEFLQRVIRAHLYIGSALDDVAPIHSDMETSISELGLVKWYSSVTPQQKVSLEILEKYQHEIAAAYISANMILTASEMD